MKAVGVGGDLTGRGADLLLIDDPIKNWEEAYSSSRRQAIWDWWQSTAYTRLEPTGSVILIMTRWHEDDLTGRFLRDMEAGGEKWDLLRLPAIADDPNDALGRAIGEPLWAQRYSADRLARIERAVGPLVWAGLFQQRPHPVGGGLFDADDWVYYDEAPSGRTAFDQQIISVDCAFKDLKTSDYVVIQVWGIKGAGAWLLHQIRDRLDVGRTAEAIARVARDYPEATAKYIEDKANGPAVIQLLRQHVGGLIAVNPIGSKQARAAAISPYQKAHNLHLPNPHRNPWVQGFVAEHESFPNGRFDDQVDATSQGISQVWLTGGGLVESLIADPNTNYRKAVWGAGSPTVEDDADEEEMENAWSQ